MLAGVIIDNRTLLFACIVGTCGALAIKFIGSGITSMIFSPFIIRYIQPTPDAEFVLLVSGSVGPCAVYVIRAIQRTVRKRGDKFAGDDEEQH